MEKLNLSKLYKSYYHAKTKPEIVDMGPAQYLSIRGKGDPNGEDYSNRVGALYPVAYAIKFKYKEKGCDFVVPKLEGLWWFDEKKFGLPDLGEAPKAVPRSEWEYRMLIRMPDFVAKEDLGRAKETALAKKGNPLIQDVEFFEMTEGKCVEILHIGSYASEPESLAKLNELIQEKAFGKNGHHHEIYLNDPRKTAPEKLKTILREPVK